MKKGFWCLLLFAVAFTAGLTGIMFHDTGIPSSISATEEVFMIETLATADAQMDILIEKAHKFIEQPAQETETCLALAKAIDRWRDTMELMSNDPVFYVITPEVLRCQQALFTKVDVELDQAFRELTEEIIRRKSEGTADEDAYKLFLEAIRRKVELSSTAPCAATNCVWCRSKQFLTWHLVRIAMPQNSN